MQIRLTHERAKQMARSLQSAVADTPKQNFRYNQALDAIARMVGLADANALAASLGQSLPDLAQDSAETLERRCSELSDQIPRDAEDWAFAIQHDPDTARADALAARLDDATARAVACAREARRRLKRTRTPRERDTLQRTIRRAAGGVGKAPGPWRQRLSEVNADGEAPPIDLLPSAKRAGFQRMAELLRPVLPEVFRAEVGAEDPELELLYDDDHACARYTITYVASTPTPFDAALHSRIEGFDGRVTEEEIRWEHLGAFRDAFAAVTAILAHADLEPVLDEAADSRQTSRLRTELARAFEAEGDGAAPPATTGDATDRPDDSDPAGTGRAPVEAATGSGKRLWWVYPHRVLRDDTSLLVRADTRAEAEREGLAFAEACCEALDWNGYDADYWLEDGYHSEPACLQCGEASESEDSSFCSAGCAQAHAEQTRAPRG